MKYNLNDIVEMKKNHACKKSTMWEIIRLGADIKIKCLGCGRVVMLKRSEFENKLKRIVDPLSKDMLTND